MPTNNKIRTLSLGLFAALSMHCLDAQQTAAQAISVPDTLTPDEEAAKRPKRPAELPPTLPKVTCQGNQLTIKAENSTMASVLAAVHACIGVEIDMPEGTSEARTYLELGPGPTRQVLESMLNSTDFNYIIESSNVSSDKIQAVVLMARTKDAVDPKAAVAANLTMTPARRAWLASRNAGRPVGSPTPEEEAHSAEAEPAESIANEGTAPPPVDSTPAAVVPIASVPKEPATDALKDPSKDTSKGSSKDAADPVDAAAKPAVASAGATEPATTVVASEAAAAASDSTQDSPAARELQNKINDMQQLFEQRKKMIANPAPPPNK